MVKHNNLKLKTLKAKNPNQKNLQSQATALLKAVKIILHHVKMHLKDLQQHHQNQPSVQNLALNAPLMN